MKCKLGMVFLILLCLGACAGEDQVSENKAGMAELLSEAAGAETIYKMEALHNGDAKLLSNNDVVTNIDGKLTIIDKEGIILKRYDDINVNWCDIWEDKVILYGNFGKEVGICLIDENYDVISNQIIMQMDTELAIDPAICLVDDEYYITVTLIEGNVNNADENQENGIYTVKMFKSTDLSTWEEVSTILTENANIEDIDLNYWDGELYLTYERETYDKSNSSLNLIISDDRGAHWDKSIILIEENADNEPAVFEKMEDCYCLYYSSDIENPGTSYEGAKVYVQEFNADFQRNGEAICVNLENNRGNLLYDVNRTDEGIWFLFTEKYITESNLVLERIYTRD